MCGLTGFALADKGQDVQTYSDISNTFSDLLLLNEERGMMATGVAMAFEDDSYLLTKKPECATKFVEENDMSLDPTCYAVLGHTRWPTNGDVKENKNNQPIRRGSVIGTHNGTISNHKNLTKRYGVRRLAEVDSEVLVQFARKGLNRFLFHASQAKGSMAFIYTDLKRNREIVMMTAEKPLAIGYVKEWGALFWSSELGHLACALADTGASVMEVKPYSGMVIKCGSEFKVTQFKLKFQSETKGHHSSKYTYK